MTELQPQPHSEAKANSVSSADFHGANTQRLSGRGWGIALLVMVLMWTLVPKLYTPNLNLEHARQFRIPFSLSEDYSIYRSYAEQTDAAAGENIINCVMLGDSVVWGEYVAKTDTWSAELTRIWNASKSENDPAQPSIQIWNFGLNGAHPTALRGLIRHHGKWDSRTALILHFNPLWITSPERDLSTFKPAPFNHPALAPQFRDRPKVYKENFGERLRVAIGQRAGFLLWAQGMRIRHLNGYDWGGWVMENPDALPWDPEFVKKTDEMWRDQGIREGVEAVSWEDQGIPRQSLEWVALEESYQWSQFLKLLDELQDQERRTLVILGPLNPWIMKEADLQQYNKILDQVEITLTEKSISCWRPDSIASELYADTSHPLAKGYTQLAEQALSSETWKNWITARIP